MVKRPSFWIMICGIAACAGAFLHIAVADGVDTSAAPGVAVLGGIVAAIAFFILINPVKQPVQEYCTRCGMVAVPEFMGKGSGFVCFLLCLLCLIPGIIYYFWMKSTEYFGCPKCQSRETVPLDSPVAQRALSQSSHV